MHDYNRNSRHSIETQGPPGEPLLVNGQTIPHIGMSLRHCFIRGGVVIGIEISGAYWETHAADREEWGYAFASARRALRLDGSK